MRIKGHKRVVAFISNAKGKRLRLELRRGRKLIARRVVRLRSGRAQAAFRPRGKGRYVLAVRANSRKRTLLAVARVKS